MTTTDPSAAPAAAPAHEPGRSPRAAGAGCPKCTGADLVRIELTPNGRPLMFTTCRQCEHRWWTDLDGHSVVGLAQVLGMVAPQR